MKKLQIFPRAIFQFLLYLDYSIHKYQKSNL